MADTGTIRITFKLYASLAQFLPAGARQHAVALDVPVGTTPNALIDRHTVPRPLAHLVMRNGNYVPPTERDTPILQDGDVLAIWPPVAGG